MDCYAGPGAGGPILLDPETVIQPGAVYSLPDVSRLKEEDEFDRRVLKKAKQLHLRRDQEHMRFGIARALLKPRSPRSAKGKSSVLSRMFKRF